MSNELNLEAERAAFELWAFDYFGDAQKTRQGDGYLYNEVDTAWRAWLVARRTAPVSAPLDTQALPPLPEFPESLKEAIMEYRLAADRVSIESIHKCRLALVRAIHDYAEEYACSVIAPYAERIAHLERELDQARGAYQGCATALEIANRAASKEAILQHLADQGQDIERDLEGRKPVSIDTAEFSALLDAYTNAAMAVALCEPQTVEDASNARAALIAYIDGRTAGTADACPEQYWSMHQGDLLHLLSVKIGAAYVDPIAAAKRCGLKIYAAPSPLPPKEEAK
jgi:hypothetical protein